MTEQVADKQSYWRGYWTRLLQLWAVSGAILLIPEGLLRLRFGRGLGVEALVPFGLFLLFAFSPIFATPVPMSQRKVKPTPTWKSSVLVASAFLIVALLRVVDAIQHWFPLDWQNHKLEMIFLILQFVFPLFLFNQASKIRKKESVHA